MKTSLSFKLNSRSCSQMKKTTFFLFFFKTQFKSYTLPTVRGKQFFYKTEKGPKNKDFSIFLCFLQGFLLVFAVFCKNKKLFRSVCKSMIYKSLYKMEEKRIDALTTEGKKWKYNEKKSCAPSDIALGKFPRFLNIFVKCLRDSHFKSIFFSWNKEKPPL